MALAYQRPTLVLFTNSSQTLLFFTRLFEHDYNILECDSLEMLKQIAETVKIQIMFLQESATEESIQSVCLEIRKLLKGSTTPVFVITKHLKQSYIKTLRQAGARGFVLEPLDEKDVLLKMKATDLDLQTKEKTSALASKIASLPTHGGDVTKKITPHVSIQKETNYNALALQIDNFSTISHMTEVSPLSYFLDHFLVSLKGQLREQDSIKEIEKGKYLILLPKTSKRAAMLIAESIKETLDELFITTKAGPQPITVSIAFASESHLEAKHPESHLTKMIELSKKRLEQAKDQGDRIIYY